jgi:putative flippase GtrA
VIAAARSLVHRRRATISRAVRCLSVSVGTTVLSATVLAVLAVGAGVGAGTANVVAVLCGIGPSYVLNRRWVWRRGGRDDFVREVVPFCALSIIGLVASTVAVARVAAIGAAWSAPVRTLALPLANLAVFGVLWLVQFVLLDRVIFVAREPSPVVIDRSFRDHHRSSAA